jgi:hypothetical protein
MIFQYFFTVPIAKTIAKSLQSWVSVMGSVALGIGAINIARIHGRYISRREPGKWVYSIILIVMIVITVGMGLFFPGGISNPIYQDWYNTFFVPSDTMIAGILGWFLIPATYRAFKARTLESFVLLISCIFVMLMNVPIGEIISPVIPKIGQWITEVPNVAGQRAFIISVAIGITILTLRTILGHEKGALGHMEEE